MADDPTKRGWQDKSQVNVHEKYEVEYLARKLGVTPAEVRQAEVKVGKSRVKVEEYLRNQK
jgi:hypothetical protein